MGNCCNKDKGILLNTSNNNQNNNQSIKLDKNNKIQKENLKSESTYVKCSDNEFKFWNELNNLNFIKLKSLNEKKKLIEFDYSSMNYHEVLFFGKLVYIYDKQSNFFLFPKIIEVLISIIDFIQLLLLLKNKYNLKDFFLVYFNKFAFFREENNSYKLTKFNTNKIHNNNYYNDNDNNPKLIANNFNSNPYRLKYLCSQINESFTNDYLFFKDDKLVSSMSMYDYNNSFMNMMSTNSNIKHFKNNFNKANKNNKIDNEDENENEYSDINNDDPDLNSYFYSKSKELYNNLRNNYNYKFEEYEYFYSEIIMNFINRFLLKKASVIKEFSNEFSQLKSLLRACFKELRKDKVSLQQLKEFLTSILSNNYELKVLISKLNKHSNIKKTNNTNNNSYINSSNISISNNYFDSVSNINNNPISINNEMLLNAAVVEFNKLNFNYQYGICDTTSTKGHSISFLYDKYINISKNNICIKCGWEDIIFKLIKKKEERVCLFDLHHEISEKYKNINFDFFYYLKYVCFVQPLMNMPIIGETGNNISDANILNNNTHYLRDTDTNSLSYIRGAKDSLKVKEFSELLLNKRSEIYVVNKLNYCVLFEIVFNDDNYRELYDTISYDVKIKELISSKNQRIDNSILYRSSQSNGGEGEKSINYLIKNKDDSINKHYFDKQLDNNNNSYLNN